MLPERSFTEACHKFLHSQWDRLLERIDKNQYIEPLGEKFVELKTLIVDCITSKTKSYHYVLPTQLLAKAVDHTLDCRTLQASCKLPGAFDARTIAHSVIVYITDLLDFARSILLLLGEQGRVDFISRVGLELDRVHSAIFHRKAWAALLKSA